MSTHRKILITGGARGIGAAIAAECARRGDEVIAPTRAELDLSRPESVEDYLQRISSIGADVLINNAGINVLKPLAEVGGSDWEEMVQTNLKAPLRLIQGVIPHM